MKTESLNPINGQILVADKKKKQETEGGIVIPDNANQDQVIQGIVVKTSDGKDSKGNIVKPDVDQGDTVLYSCHAAAQNILISDEGVTIRFLRPVEVMAKIEE